MQITLTSQNSIFFWILPKFLCPFIFSEFTNYCHFHRFFSLAEFPEILFKIKRVITKAPVLVSPDYAKSFYIYSFASDHSCAGMLTQNSYQGNEHPIAFMSASLKDAELRYPSVEK